VIVKLSTNCGLSWINLKTYTRLNPPGNLLSGQQISLSAYAGQNIIMGFYGSEGTVNDLNDYDVHIDDIEVMVPLGNDLSATEVLNLPGACGPGPSFPLSVKVFNNGAIAQNSIVAAYSMNGQAPVSQTFNQVLAPGQSTTISFSDPLSLPNPGTYKLSVFTNQAVDSNRTNDTVKAVLIRPDSVFSAINFTGFTGGNLSTLYPGWREGTGFNGTGTTSSWTISSAAQTTFFGGTTTARINLFGNTKKDWIISKSVSPRTNSLLRFKMAVTDLGTGNADAMGSDDSLVVKVSTNCGASWIRVSAITASTAPGTTLTTKIVPLEQFAGSSILIGLMGTEGSVNDINDYDLHVTAIEVFTPSENDLAIQSVLTPSQDCGAPPSFNLKVRVLNNGTQAQADVPVVYRLGSLPVVSEVFNQTLNPGQTAEFTFTNPINLPNIGTYSLSVWTALPGDGNVSNDSVKNIVLTRAGSGFNVVTFQGFTGANLSTLFPGWTEGAGLIPSGTTSGWTSSNATQSTFLGSTTAKINLFTGTKKDWMLSQPFTPAAGSFLKYKVALTNFAAITPDSMGSDDSLIVRATTNCGLTWTNLKTYTKANPPSLNLMQESISLAGFAGQSVRIGFYGSEGSVDDLNDYDVHIDDVEVFVPSPNDLGIQTIFLPDPNCGASNPFPVKVKVINNGTQTQNTISLGYRVSGQAPVEQSFSQTMLPGASAEFTFSAPAAFPIPGTYQISAWTALSGDGNVLNDSLLNQQVTRPGPDFALINFTGFTGANLGTVFPGWREQTGLNPTGTFSSWTVSSAAQITGFGSAAARVTMIGVTKREWMLSPPFAPASGQLLKFKVAVTSSAGVAAANMGADDSLIVKVSTNCGQSWVRVQAFTAASGLTNAMTEKSIPLGFAGQNVILAFYATEGTVDDPIDYDILVDDISLSVPPASDVSLQEILFPNGDCGGPPSLNVKIQVANFGSVPQSGFPVSYRVNNQAVVTETFSGTLASGQSAVYTFAPTVSLDQPGDYFFSAWTGLSGDLVSSNDSVKNKKLTKPGEALVQADFNAFNGTNLSTLYEGWNEATGAGANPGNASWVNSTGSQTGTLGSQTARINMNSNLKRDWLISAVVSPVAASNLKFKMAVTIRNFGFPATSGMGSDDSVNVMVSTNCGVSWTRLRVFTAASNLTNALQEFTVPLGAFAGQPIRIGFFATEGVIDDTQDFDFHLDDVFVSISTSIAGPELQNRMALFPNPARERVTLRLPEGSKPESIAVYSIQGKRFSLPEIPGEGQDNVVFDVSQLPAGMYKIRISTDTRSEIQTLLVE
jgi:hypothetical protein